MTIRLYQYPTCSTCKKAIGWLSGAGIEFTTIHIAEKPPSRATLKRLWKRSGLPIRKFFNTSGKSYRAGGFTARIGTMSDDEALDELARDGMLIKRPILDADDLTLVGFKEADWKARLDR